MTINTYFLNSRFILFFVTISQKNQKLEKTSKKITNLLTMISCYKQTITYVMKK